MNKVKELDYKSECIFYLGMEIMKALFLEGQHMYIDVYYDTINENEQKILNQVSKAFEL